MVADDPEVHETSLAAWDRVVDAFQDIFDGLGDISKNGDSIQFESRMPGVSTAIVLRRDGLIGASMPLHGVEARMESVRWDGSRSWVQLVGKDISYTYRIPPELLRHRDV